MGSSELELSKKMKVSLALTCLAGSSLAQGWRDESNDCGYADDINDQIKREVNASLFYQSLHYHFSRQVNNRPNFAKILAARANEEREHADVLAKFQLERGYAVNLDGLDFRTNSHSITTVKEALNKMIEKEKELTGSLKALHKKAETGVLKNRQFVKPGKECRDPLIDEKTCQAPHLADLMTSTYLPEQMKDIHELQVLYNKIVAFTPEDDQGQAEILFDKLILKD